MPTISCPVCGVRFTPEASRPLPFCCERCRLIDLKRWLGEEYSMPARPSEAESEDEGFDDDSSD